MATKIITYAPGEKRCDRCGEALGQTRYSASRKYFVCEKPDCRNPAYMPVPIQFISKDKMCDGFNCTKLAEQRAYPAWTRFFFCSHKCKSKHRTARGPIDVRCAYCKKNLGRCTSTVSGLHFCMGHNALYRRQQQDMEQCGVFLDIFRNYNVKFADHHYRGTVARNIVRAFLGTLTSESVIDLNDVTLAHIGRFVALQKQTRQTPRAEFIKVFFDHLIEQGIYRQRNPVRPLLHYTLSSKSEPRPYDSTTIANLWMWLEARGDTRSKVITALGEECGPLLDEICDIQLKDIDLAGHRIRIEAVGQDGIENWIPYHTKSALWLKAWLDERPKDCGHNYLLTNSRGDPLHNFSVRDLLTKVFCKKSKFCEHEEGLTSFDWTRLRDANIQMLRQNGMDDVVNMIFHRIKSVASVKRFDKILDEHELDQYRSAMDLN